MSILGNRVVRREDPALLTVGGTYVEDVVREGTAHVAFVRSTMAHARITAIDTSEAEGAPGVLAVVSAADLDLPPMLPIAFIDQRMARPILADGVVRFVGEPVVAVVAETRGQAVDAAEQVIVELDPLPVVIDMADALTDTVVLHPEVGTNVALAVPGLPEPLSFEGCDVVVTTTTANQRLAPAPIEPRRVLAWWEGDRLTVEIACQGAHPIQAAYCEIFGLDPDHVRVICPDVGGGFGAKSQPGAEALLTAELARRTGRPVRYSETRSENMVSMGHGRGQVQTVTLGGTSDGKLLAYRLEILQDGGAYPHMGAILPFAGRIMCSGVYDIPAVEFSSRSVATNTTPTGAYRGAGRPEATAAIERAIDLFAAEAGLDPAEVRRRNVVAPDAFPFTTPTGTVYDSGDYGTAIDKALDAAGYDQLRAEQARRRAAGDRRLLGIGVSCYVEITGVMGGPEYGSVELLADGGARVVTGSTPYGQGHVTAWAMLVEARTGIPMDRVEVVYGDTDVVPSSEVTGGSRSLQIAGSAVHVASGMLVEMATERAADLLEASAHDVVLDAESGRFHVVGSPAVSVGWDDVAGTLDGTAPMLAVSDFAAPGPTFPFGAHVAVVEVDADTGKVDLVRMVACDDAGVILNPLLVDGQVHGGLAQGAAQALFEQVVYDAEGNPLTTTFADYSLPSAAELPSFERIELQTPTPVNPLGAKGIGESGTIGATPAVQSAVIDALAHLGVRHLDMPLTPEKVWRAIGQATSAAGAANWAL